MDKLIQLKLLSISISSCCSIGSRLSTEEKPDCNNSIDYEDYSYTISSNMFTKYNLKFPLRDKTTTDSPLVSELPSAQFNHVEAPSSINSEIQDLSSNQLCDFHNANFQEVCCLRQTQLASRLCLFQYNEIRLSLTCVSHVFRVIRSPLFIIRGFLKMDVDICSLHAFTLRFTYSFFDMATPRDFIQLNIFAANDK